MSDKKQKISILKRLNFRYYQIMAKIGDKSEQDSLGYCYAKGLGVERNLPKAAAWREWLEEEAEKQFIRNAHGG